MTDVTDINLAFNTSGGRADRVTMPLDTTNIQYTINPDLLQGYDLLLADTPDREMLKYMLRAKLRGLPVLFRMRGDPYWGIDEWVNSRVKEYVIFEMLRRVDGCIPITSFQADKYHRHTGNATHVVGLPNQYTNWSDTTHTGNDLRFVTLTNAVYQNKIQPLIEIADVVNTALERHGGTWKIGSWSTGFHEQLEDLANSHKHIEFYLNMDAHAALEWGNAMIHYSGFDALPNAILEGMASKMPVITNDHKAFTEIGKPLLITASEKELRDTLQQVRNPKKRQSVGVNSLKYVENNHAPQIIGKQFVEVIDQYV